MNSEKRSSKSKKWKQLLNNICYDFVKLTGAIPVLLYLRPKIYKPFHNKTPKKGVLVSANHRSLTDPIVVHTVYPFRRMHCLATKELFNTKVKDVFFHLMNCIVVDKENFALSSFHEVVSKLSEGKMVVIFPEGGINSDREDTIRAFKSGAVLMAYKSKTPILPIYIVKREKWYHRQRIIVGKPFDVCEAVGKMPTLEQLNKASEMLREREIELRSYFESLPVYQRLSKKATPKQPKEERNIENEQTV